MIETLRIADTLIGIAPIPAGERGTRRERERAAVQAIADQLLGADAAIGHDEHGAPTIPNGYISVSHSRSQAAVAINANTRIGIDAEEWRDALRRISPRFLSEAETQWASDEQLLTLWTIKEAVYKAAADHKLLLTAIESSPNLATASANGRQYDLHTFTAHADTITLAIAQP